MLGREHVIDDDPGLVGRQRPDHHRVRFVDAAEHVEVRRQVAGIGEAHRLVGQPRHLPEQRLRVGGVGRGVVERAETAVLLHVEHEVVDVDVATEGVEVEDLDVIEVLHVLHHELPVAVEIDHVLGRQPRLLVVEEGELLLVLGRELGERHRVRIEVDEHPAAPFVAAERRQTGMIRGSKPGRLLHVGRAHQLALEVVEPAMVGAAELLGVARAAGDLDAAVPADVGECADIAVIVAGDDDRLVHDPERHVVARILDLLHATDAEPVLHEDLFLLELVDLRRGIDVARQVPRLVQCVAGPGKIAVARGEGFGDGHGILPVSVVLRL